MLERKFQTDLIKELRHMFPGCIVLKNDSRYVQGMLDLLILYKNRWAALECKKSIKEPYQPNQEYYIGEMNDMSFASMICPENKQEVLDELQQTFTFSRTSCVS